MIGTGENPSIEMSSAAWLESKTELPRERPAWAVIRSGVSNPGNLFLSAVLHPESPVSYTVISRSELIRNKGGRSVKPPSRVSCVTLWCVVFTFWKTCLSANRDGLALISVSRKITWYAFAVHCSRFINHFRTHQSTSTHKSTHTLILHLTRDPSVDSSADTFRTVVTDFLFRFF
jgi:hypothetical protein